MDDNKITTATETATDANNGKNEAGKTFTQQDMDNLAGKVRSEEKAKYEKITQDAIASAIQEHERQAKLTQDEREKEARKKREQELENRDLEITMRERTIEAKEALIKEGIPVNLVEFVVNKDKDTTNENITKLSAAYKKAVEEGVAEKLKGQTPNDYKNDQGSTKPKIIRAF